MVASGPHKRELSPLTMLAMEDALVAIAKLGGRVSASSVGAAWQRRAAWSGYARALQLQGGEVDEIDVISWGSDVALPARPRRHTHDDEFASFESWLGDLHRHDRDAWRDTLPFTPEVDRSLPRIIQAIDLTRQYARHTGGIDAWLELPRFLYRLGLSASPLPCLVAGAKAYRLQPRLTDDVLRSTMKGLAASGRQGLATLDDMETSYRASVRAIRSEYRPGNLPGLLALSLNQTVLSPARVAARLGLSVAGAGRLLKRAGEIGVVVEISGRRSWKAYVEPQLAVGLGLRKASLGRPAKEPPPLLPEFDSSGVLDAFDRALADIDAQLARIGVADRLS